MEKDDVRMYSLDPSFFEKTGVRKKRLKLLTETINAKKTNFSNKMVFLKQIFSL